MTKLILTIGLLATSGAGLLGTEAQRATRTTIDVIANQIDRLHAATESKPAACG